MPFKGKDYDLAWVRWILAEGELEWKLANDAMEENEP
jgi:hypothetical protein